MLGVSRSLWSLYELGQRDLPLHAKRLLAEMLAHIQSHDVGAKTANLSNPEVKQQQLERLLRDNEYQQLLLARRIAATTKKQEAQARLLLLADFLKSRNTSKQSSAGAYETILSKANQVEEAPFSDTVDDLHHRQEILALEKLLLESRLRKITGSTEFTED